MMNKDHKKRRKKRLKRSSHTLIWVIFVEAVIVVLGLMIVLWPKENEELDALLEQDVKIDYIEDDDAKLTLYVPRPDIDEQLLTINDYSRPGTKTDGINYIVVHYLANPKTTAQENHDYFESLKDLQNVSMSANYVIGLEGEIIQCVPDDEIAYASNGENHDSISIENCHMDTTGKFNEATYDSLVKLVAYLTEKYELDRDQIIRHYDVTGKECPKYFVDHEDRWEEFKDEVMAYREQCQEDVKSQETEADVLANYLESELETE
ncbi:MAG: peptidoglycan recognition family protein [Lachnospiraceae bacterium]|nr:peptidoglycan recognition family protein [Lachnospiraceae bacterium]MDD3796032.1 peptidoglycan recognition family protein [Lachnospiraceae bacterium]